MDLIQTSIEMGRQTHHYPVMHREVIELLNIKEKKIIIDCTVGMGSHALKFCNFMGEDALLIGIDKDKESLAVASHRLNCCKGKVILIRDDFSYLNDILKKLKIDKVDIFFFDLGLSMYQLNNSERGFSFLKEGPLDMRMDRDSFVSAYDLINNLSEKELELIFRKFGEEHYSKKIAHYIIEARKNRPISTTTQLVNVILKAMPSRAALYRIHPATRTFQALRIAVNRELEVLSNGLESAISFLSRGGRIGVISFHSLEDRIAKHTFKDFASRGILRLITKKPLLPAQNEVAENPASRSAKLRVAEKV
ncbi:MAG: 16S rRNA (cytosine(1402)-N(4))-methyltransferase RsmH [Candidatus Omnitrophota bacterium]|nr:MAG: 16S rRNA (cytosine(1402)-N(4))-methyltransferase RsmH [Candidatus Omnitrophota bacterium]